MPFVTESLFITFYVPVFPCERCGTAAHWTPTSQIRCTESQPTWTARTHCKGCGKVTDWQVNPDVPMDDQAFRSRLHDGSVRHIE